MKLLTKNQRISYLNPKICYICKTKFEDKSAKDKNIVKLGTIVIMQWNIEMLHIAYVIQCVTKEFPIVFNDGL